MVGRWNYIHTDGIKWVKICKIITDFLLRICWLLWKDKKINSKQTNVLYTFDWMVGWLTFSLVERISQRQMSCFFVDRCLRTRFLFQIENAHLLLGIDVSIVYIYRLWIETLVIQKNFQLSNQRLLIRLILKFLAFCLRNLTLNIAWISTDLFKILLKSI